MTEDLDARIGRNLRECRLKAGLDLDALARRTGLQPAMIGLFETGRSRIPVEMLLLFARTLARPLDDFFA